MSKARARGARPASKSWHVAVYKTADGKHPALEYLGGVKVPDQPRRELLLTVLAVVQMGPLEFPTGTTRWRLMHKPAKKGDVDMSGIFEARDRHNRILYEDYLATRRVAALKTWPEWWPQPRG